MIGATVVVGGVPKRIRASKAVLLATGGFAHNQEMLRRYGPATPHRFSLCNPACTGAGIQAALDAGASVDRALSSVGFWTPASASREKNGADTPVIYGYLDRGRPGVIAVNEQGKRFVNEADSYHDIVSAIFANGGADGRPFHFITDRAFVRRHGLGTHTALAMEPLAAPLDSPWLHHRRQHARQAGPEDRHRSRRPGRRRAAPQPKRPHGPGPRLPQRGPRPTTECSATI